jgi:hypothetical protein
MKNIDHDHDLRPNVLSVANRIEDPALRAEFIRLMQAADQAARRAAAIRLAGWSLARAAGAAPPMPRK